MVVWPSIIEATHPGHNFFSSNTITIYPNLEHQIPLSVMGSACTSKKGQDNVWPTLHASLCRYNEEREDYWNFPLGNSTQSTNRANEIRICKDY